MIILIMSIPIIAIDIRYDDIWLDILVGDRDSDNVDSLQYRTLLLLLLFSLSS